jgi:hypothetical protein
MAGCLLAMIPVSYEDVKPEGSVEERVVEKTVEPAKPEP